jgi:hypothetical protein
MKTIQEVNSAIMFGTWTNDELTSMIDAIKFNRASLAKHTKQSLKMGQMVRFTSSRTGKVMVGDVTKIAIKFVTVRTPQGLWKVPANMLEAA